jgi:molecular chaperone GrpE (heat shock protein)
MELNIGDFIFHNSFGVGRVQEIKFPINIEEHKDHHPKSAIPYILIKFKDGDPQSFSSDLLGRSASRISPVGYRALAYIDLDKAKQLLEIDPVGAIELLLQDFPNLTAKTDDFKDYLAPYVTDWGVWWEKVQPKLKESPRIDSSKSKHREYRIARELQSPAEEKYISFHRLRSFESKSKLFDQAKRVLEQYGKGSPLSEEHLQDVLNFVWQIIELRRDEISLRLDALFRLQDGKWIENDQASLFLEEMLEPGLKIFDLNIYTINRLVNYIIDNPLTETRKSILAGSICSNEQVIKSIIEWALHKGDPDFIALLLKTALQENIPTRSNDELVDSCAIRLGHAERLVTLLPANSPSWETIITSHRKLVQSVSELDLGNYSSIVPALVGFSRVLFEYVNPYVPEMGNKIIDNLLHFSLPMRFIVELVLSAKNSKKEPKFGQILEKNLWGIGEERNYDFLARMIEALETDQEKIKVLVNTIKVNRNPLLVEKIGNMVCEIVSKNKMTDPLVFLPDLNFLNEIKGKWNWSFLIASLRENIFFEMFSRSSDNLVDHALLSANRRTIDSSLREKNEEILGLELKLQQEIDRNQRIENQVTEKDQVIRELRSGFGGDTADARFEEKVRIVKELASSVAEFERMLTRADNKSLEGEAIILRLNNLIKGMKVTPMEAIGTQVQFNPQKHRLIDSSLLEPGKKVIVVERGFLIRDNHDKMRLLKPALVKQYLE